MGLEINYAIIAGNLPSVGALFTSLSGRSIGGGSGSDGLVEKQRNPKKIKIKTFKFYSAAVRKEKRKQKHHLAGLVADIGISNLGGGTTNFGGTVLEEEWCKSVQ